MVGELIEPGGEAVGVLRPHRRERAEDDQVQRPLEQLDAGAVFTGHCSEVEPGLHWNVKWSAPRWLPASRRRSGLGGSGLGTQQNRG